MRITGTIGTWRLRLALLASVCAIASLSAEGAARANHSIDVNFTIDSRNFPPPSSSAYAFGHVDPGPTPCRRDRTFGLYKLEPRILIDTGRSSNNGFFALGGDLSGASSVQVKMDKRKFGPRGNRHTCEPDANTFGF